MVVNDTLKTETSGRYELIEVKGDDIIKYYKKEHIDDIKYSDKQNDSLLSSCMVGKEFEDFFDIYADNREQVSLLIYRNNETDLILGRALIWDNGHEKYMDTIYSMNADVDKLFREYDRKTLWWNI